MCRSNNKKHHYLHWADLVADERQVCRSHFFGADDPSSSFFVDILEFSSFSTLHLKSTAIVVYTNSAWLTDAIAVLLHPRMNHDNSLSPSVSLPPVSNAAPLYVPSLHVTETISRLCMHDWLALTADNYPVHVNSRQTLGPAIPMC